MLDADTFLGNKKSILSEIAPKIIVYAYPKKKTATALEVKSLFAAYEELTVGLDITSVEYLSKIFSKDSYIGANHESIFVFILLSYTTIHSYKAIATCDAKSEKEAIQN